MDPFTLLDLPRRPWLEPDAIRAAFQARARQSHPDAAGGDTEAFTALNAAHAALSDPGTRLRLLAGETPLPSTPSDITLGFHLADFLRRATALSEQASSASNALTRALAAKEVLTLRAEAGEISAALESTGRTLESRLRDLDVRWPQVEPREIAALAAEHLFFKRWSQQLREARVSLEIVARPGAISPQP